MPINKKAKEKSTAVERNKNPLLTGGCKNFFNDKAVDSIKFYSISMLAVGLRLENMINWTKTVFRSWGRQRAEQK